MDRFYVNTIRHFRKEANLRQIDVSVLSGISQSQVSKLEDGSRWPIGKTIVRLCRAYGIPTKAFFTYLHQDLGEQLKKWVEPEEGSYDD